MIDLLTSTGTQAGCDELNYRLSNTPYKIPCQAATTANITLSSAQTIDGVSLSVNDFVLVKNQTAGLENGVYSIVDGAWTRRIDANTADELLGSVIYIKEGTVNKGTRWQLNTDLPITLETTALSFGSADYIPIDGVDDSTIELDGTLKVKDDGIANVKLANMAANTIKGRITAGTGDPEDLTVAQCISVLGVKPIVQYIYSQTGAVASSATIIPLDDTIPQNTEGVEFLSLAITPKSVTNILIIDITLHLAINTSAWGTAALFQDTNTNALAAFASFAGGENWACNISFKHTMVAGTTSETTFKVRVGPDTTATITFNGYGSTNRRLGGKMASTIAITEITA